MFVYKRPLPRLKPVVNQGFGQSYQQARRSRLEKAVKERQQLRRAEQARQAAPSQDPNASLDAAISARSDRVSRQIDRLQAEIKADDASNS